MDKYAVSKQTVNSKFIEKMQQMYAKKHKQPNSKATIYLKNQEAEQIQKTIMNSRTRKNVLGCHLRLPKTNVPSNFFMACAEKVGV